jgi:mannosyltransferase
MDARIFHQAGRSSGIRRSTEYFLVVGIVLLTVGLRFAPFAARSLNADEASTVQFATLEWNAFLRLLGSYELNAAPYYLLLRVWPGLGTTEIGLRALSLLAGVAALPLLIAFGARFLSRRVGLLAGFLLAISPLHILHSQNARGYSLAVLLVLLSCFFLLEGVRRPSRWSWGGYITASVLAVYAHFFAALVLPAQWASLPFLRRENMRWSAWIARIGAILLFLVPLGLFVVLRDVGQIGWISRPDAADLADAFRRLSGGRWSLLVLFVVLVASGVLGAWKERRSRETGVTAFLLAWFLVPILLSFLISMRKPVFTASYLIVSLPALLLVAAVGLSRIPSAALRTAVLATIVLLSAKPLAAYYRAPYQIEGYEQWRQAVRFILAEARPGDAIFIHSGSTRVAYDYYVDQSASDSDKWVPPVAYPAGDDFYVTRPDATADQAALVRALKVLPARYDRVWLVLSHDEVTPRQAETSLLIRKRFAAHYSLAASRAFRGVRVLLFEE